jgi:hypothetical protein
MFSSPFLEQFSYMNTKDIYHILPLSPFPYALPLILVPTPRKDLFYLPIFHFLKKNLVYITSSSGFHFGIADMYISCFKQINRPHYSFSVTMLRCYSSAYGDCIIVSSYTHAICVILHSLTFFPSPASCCPLRHSH